MKELEPILAANRRYARSFEPRPNVVARGLAILTCMDARLDPARALGLHEGDAHVIRNAGGVASDDALRSLVISHWRLGTRAALVIGHTGCGMVTFTDAELRAKLETETGADTTNLRFLAFRNVEQQVRESVRVLRETPLLPASYEVAGLVLDVETGLLELVVS